MEEERGGVAEEKASKKAWLCLQASTAYYYYYFYFETEEKIHLPPTYLHTPPCHHIYWFNFVLLNALSFILHISTCSYN